VNVTLTQGGVQLQTVAKAMEAGSFGESIKVKNEQTGDIYEVTLTGPQTATMGASAGGEDRGSKMEDRG
jgi:flagella basal body P-ring formation protein FlgA